jgi:hypothetical protein
MAILVTVAAMFIAPLRDMPLEVELVFQLQLRFHFLALPIGLFLLYSTAKFIEMISIFLL